MLEGSAGRRHIYQFHTLRTFAVGSTGADRLELHRAVSRLLFVCIPFVCPHVYVHDAYICLLAFGDDEY
jgi:hypothetical protein